jgi:hypothetical protein
MTDNDHNAFLAMHEHTWSARTHLTKKWLGTGTTGKIGRTSATLNTGASNVYDLRRDRLPPLSARTSVMYGKGR